MKEIYDWVPWFQKLAERIEEGREDFLVEKAMQVEWGGKPSLLQYGAEAINPFSFFYFLAFKNTPKKWRPVYESVSDVFEIERINTDVDEDYVFPRTNFGVLFYDEEDPQSALLWRLFRQAAKNRPEIDPDDFLNVLGIKGVKITKLTHALFLINPHYFLPVDSASPELLEALSLPIPSAIEVGGYGAYRSFLNRAKKVFPGCQPFEINMFLYLTKPTTPDKFRIQVSDSCYHISTNVFDPEGGDYWENRDGSFKENNWVYAGGPGPGKSWDEEGSYPLTEPERGDIVLVRTGVQKGRAIGVVQENEYAELGKNRDSRIHVLWVNKGNEDLSTKTRQNALEKIKPDWKTYQAFQETHAYKPTFNLIDLLIGNKREPMKNPHPLNQILYGPPGTSKTWHTVNHALAIIDNKPVGQLEMESKEDREAKMQRFDKLKKNGQIEMVTFHQNYNYEDFIEGIRPVLTGAGEESVEYELSDGVFKEIAFLADENRMQSEKMSGDSWDVDELIEAFAVSIAERLESEDEIKLFPHDHKSGVTIAKIHWSRGSFQSVQLGGTLTDQRLSKKMIKRDYDAFYNGEVKTKEDIKPTYRSGKSYHGNARYYFELFKRVKEFHDNEWTTERPVSVAKQNYVLIIDEINRGNIAKIFGELITLIEESKRIGGNDETTATLPYSGEDFGVPDNLYIIGTMNTADRSIALLDTALRRRFDFVEMMPDPTLVPDDIEGINCQELLKVMNERIRFLLDREHQIGHTYFMNIDGLKSLEERFRNRILPLLQEYFYDNWEKIDLVLNRNGFIVECEIPENLRSEQQLIDEEKNVYEFLPAANSKWTDPANYQSIYGGKPPQEDTPEAEPGS